MADQTTRLTLRSDGEWRDCGPVGVARRADSPVFSRTDARRRIREALRESGVADRVRGLRQELNSREVPAIITEPPTTRYGWMPDGDDLRDQYALSDGLRSERERRVGQVVDIAFHEASSWPNLRGNVWVWLGTEEHAPRVLVTIL
ncbi:MAG: hypothetical protein R3246_08775 [Acidimicrobiia bacterium]|nr:hypothetical protein [Acidimicrobiia bacterium]